MSRGLSNDPILRNAPAIEGYKLFGPCLLQSRVGQGGMGVVYRGVHVNLGVDVAVKCLLPALAALNDDLVARFQREAHLAARVTHQNLVRVYDVGKQHGVHYIVMEYVTGETLSDRVERKGSSSPAEAFHIFLQAARGLAAAHAEKVVHRDIKPANVMVSTRGVVKVADLGLGRLSESGVDGTAAVVRMGTPTFMPPEQWQSFALVGPRGDVWALGATVHYLLAGTVPFAGSLLEIERRICGECFPSIRGVCPDVPDELVAVLEKSTQLRPEDRYRDARELVAELERLARIEPFASSLVQLEAVDSVRCAVRDAKRRPGLPTPPPRVVEEAKKLEASRVERAASESLESPAPGPLTRTERKSVAGRGWVFVTLLLLLGLAALGSLEWIRREIADLRGLRDDERPVERSTVELLTPRAIHGFRYRGESPQGLSEYEHERTGIRMVLLQGGTFLMGSLGNDPDARPDEKPAHLVALSPFLIGKYEVSQSEWENAGEENRAQELDRGPRLPAVNVSWEMCERFCEKNGLRLPTEAQWEFACRAGSKGIYSCGDTLAPEVANVANSVEPRRLKPVDDMAPNAFGLVQMHGNVWEWCQDAYDPGFYTKLGSRTPPVRDPVCTSGEDRVYRGGSLAFPAEDCRSAARWSDEPGFEDPGVGFRVSFPLGE